MTHKDIRTLEREPGARTKQVVADDFVSFCPVKPLAPRQSHGYKNAEPCREK